MTGEMREHAPLRDRNAEPFAVDRGEARAQLPREHIDEIGQERVEVEGFFRIVGHEA